MLAKLSPQELEAARQLLSGAPCIWTGAGFVPTDKTALRQETHHRLQHADVDKRQHTGLCKGSAAQNFPCCMRTHMGTFNVRHMAGSKAALQARLPLHSSSLQATDLPGVSPQLPTDPPHRSQAKMQSSHQQHHLQGPLQPADIQSFFLSKSHEFINST